MYGFSRADIADETPLYTLFRQRDVLCIRVNGVVDDARSEAWRAGVRAHVASVGYPRFALLDTTGSDPQNSLRSRLASATFARDVARRIEWGAVLVAGSGTLFVVRTVMRVVGMPNIHIMQSATEFDVAIESCRAGRRPPRWGTLAAEA